MRAARRSALGRSAPQPITRELYQQSNDLHNKHFQVSSINKLSANSSDSFFADRAFISLAFDSNKTTAIKCLFDTGASVSLLTVADFEKFKRRGLVRSKLNCNPILTTASGERLPHQGAYDIKFFHNSKPCHGIFIVSQSLPKHSIVGMNIITKYAMSLDPITKTISSSSTPHIPTQASRIQHLIKVAETCTLTHGNATKVRCRLADPHSKTFVTSPYQFLASVGNFTFACQSNDSGSFYIHLPNSDTIDHTLARGTELGTASSLLDVNFITNDKAVDELKANTPTPRPHTPAEVAQIRSQLKHSIDTSHIPYAHKQTYFEMLCQYEDVFSAHSLDLGLSDLTAHDIQLTDHNDPAYKGQFRLAFDQLQLIKDNVVGWLKAGLIERSNSKFNSPVFCVPKKEGQGLRVVLDYRQLNHKSIPDKYSIRTIDQCLEEIGQANSKIFSCLDLTNGFWQLSLAENARPYTSFTIPGKGQFQWRVMPQGLMGAPASFSRLMDLIMSDASNIITYIDDVLVHSASHEDHVTHIKTALSRLRAAHLRLNAKKCTFGASSVQYLGHTITAEGVKPGKNKTEALLDCQPPKTVKQLRAFLGLANYFRLFINNFAERAAPLFRLTRKDANWTENHPLPPPAATAFEDIKKSLCSGPVLAFPNRTGRYTLTVDSAQGDDKNLGGMGACLLQEQPDGTIKPVGYASRQLLKYEYNYPPFLLEMGAAVFGMEFFHHYLVGRRFTLLTDHKPLVPLSVTHTKTLNRLQLKMQDMHPDVGYIPGGQNTVSDFLSRYKGMGISKNDLTHEAGVSVNAIDLTLKTISQHQRTDPACKTLLSKLRAFPPNTDVRVANSTYFRDDKDCIFVKLKTRKGFINTNPVVLLAPQVLRPAILKEAHNSLIGGHGGRFKTMERIRKIVWWPSLDKDIADHIDQCPTCGANPHASKPQVAHNRLPTPPGPNHRIHVDLFGPLKSSTNGNSYVLIYTDAFTRLTRLTPIPNKNAETVAAAILNWIYLFGVPQSIISDQGREFCNELSQNIMSALNIEHKTTTPYHPQCNAAAERFNRTMAEYLTKAIADSNSSTLDWELYLGPLTLSFNSAVNKSTRVSPYYATFGVDPKIPLWTTDLDSPITNHDFATDLHNLRNAQATAHKIIHLNDQHEKTIPTPQQTPIFNKFDRIWITRKQTLAPNPKLNQSCDPGIVLSQETAVTYRVLNLNRKRKRPFTVNVSQIRPRHSAHNSDAKYVDIPTTINTIENTKLIQHLLPQHARSMPLLQALPYINHGAVDSDDIVNLLLSGCNASSHLAAEQRFHSLQDDALFLNLPDDVAAGQAQYNTPAAPPPPKRQRPATLTIPQPARPAAPPAQSLKARIKDTLNKFIPQPFRQSTRLDRWGFSPPNSNSDRSRSPRIFFPETSHSATTPQYRDNQSASSPDTPDPNMILGSNPTNFRVLKNLPSPRSSQSTPGNMPAQAPAQHTQTHYRQASPSFQSADSNFNPYTQAHPPQTANNFTNYRQKPPSYHSENTAGNSEHLFLDTNSNRSRSTRTTRHGFSSNDAPMPGYTPSPSTPSDFPPRPPTNL